MIGPIALLIWTIEVTVKLYFSPSLYTFDHLKNIRFVNSIQDVFKHVANLRRNCRTQISTYIQFADFVLSAYNALIVMLSPLHITSMVSTASWPCLFALFFKAEYGIPHNCASLYRVMPRSSIYCCTLPIVFIKHIHLSLD